MADRENSAISLPLGAHKSSVIYAYWSYNFMILRIIISSGFTVKTRKDTLRGLLVSIGEYFFGEEVNRSFDRCKNSNLRCREDTPDQGAITCGDVRMNLSRRKRIP